MFDLCCGCKLSTGPLRTVPIPFGGAIIRSLPLCPICRQVDGRTPRYVLAADIADGKPTRRVAITASAEAYRRFQQQTAITPHGGSCVLYGGKSGRVLRAYTTIA
jgi:hypothetical protein